MIYPLLVDYDTLFGDIIELGNYYYVGEDIPDNENLKRGEKGIIRMVAKIFHFHCISTVEIIKSINEAGYRPADYMQLLSFGKQYPNIKIQEDFAIVALGTDLQNSYTSPSPYLFAEICVRRFGRALVIVEDWDKNEKGWGARPSENAPYFFFFLGVKAE